MECGYFFAVGEMSQCMVQHRNHTVGSVDALPILANSLSFINNIIVLLPGPIVSHAEYVNLPSGQEVQWPHLAGVVRYADILRKIKSIVDVAKLCGTRRDRLFGDGCTF